MDKNVVKEPKTSKSKSQFVEFDVSAYNDYFGGGTNSFAHQAFLKTVEKFLELSEDRFNKLESTLLAGNYSDAALLAHQIKGSLKTLGGTRLAKEVEVLENAVEIGPESLNRACGLFDRLLVFNRELSSFCKSLSK